jgi:acetyltransferase-like isoleucine patch superfamily enzyme
MRKIWLYYKIFGLTNIVRKIVVVLKYRLRTRLFGRLKSYFYFKSTGALIGSNVTFKGVCYQVHVGEDVNIYNNCIFEFGDDANLSIGSHVIFAYGVVVSVNNNIKIGSHVQFGEYTSIRDTTHDSKLCDIPIMKMSDIGGDIIIGNNVWIGRGCVILPNTRIEDNVVFGANSVIYGSYESGNLYGGARAKFIKNLYK